MNNRGSSLITLVVVLGFGFILCALMALWTQSNLDFWLSHFKGHAIHVPYWMSLIISVVLNAVILGANIIAEIAKLCI